MKQELHDVVSHKTRNEELEYLEEGCCFFFICQKMQVKLSRKKRKMLFMFHRLGVSKTENEKGLRCVHTRLPAFNINTLILFSTNSFFLFKCV